MKSKNEWVGEGLINCIMWQLQNPLAPSTPKIVYTRGYKITELVVECTHYYYYEEILIGGGISTFVFIFIFCLVGGPSSSSYLWWDNKQQHQHRCQFTQLENCDPPPKPQLALPVARPWKTIRCLPPSTQLAGTHSGNSQSDHHSILLPPLNWQIWHAQGQHPHL
jgi:hypothetical protein